MSSKSAVKLVVPNDKQGLLFKWVSLLTGSKNALKGFGFFIGGYLLSTLGFEGALVVMALALLAVLIGAALYLKAELGKAKSKIRGKDLFSKSREINFLSAARIFLFASRDVWFVVGVPVFLAEVAGWSFQYIGTFMAVWVIGYGIVQASVPKVLRRVSSTASAAVGAKVWGFVLALLPAAIAVVLISGAGDMVQMLVGGLILFGIVFAINSALHSYLIVAYSDGDKVALNVGFYYMANAVGRLMGTFLSGLVYQLYGLEACLVVSAVMVLLAVVFALPLGGKKAEGKAA